MAANLRQLEVLEPLWCQEGFQVISRTSRIPISDYFLVPGGLTIDPQDPPNVTFWPLFRTNRGPKWPSGPPWTTFWPLSDHFLVPTGVPSDPQSPSKLNFWTLLHRRAQWRGGRRHLDKLLLIDDCRFIIHHICWLLTIHYWAFII